MKVLDGSPITVSDQSLIKMGGFSKRVSKEFAFIHGMRAWHPSIYCCHSVHFSVIMSFLYGYTYNELHAQAKQSCQRTTRIPLLFFITQRIAMRSIESVVNYKMEPLQ